MAKKLENIFDQLRARREFGPHKLDRQLNEAQKFLLDYDASYFLGDLCRRADVMDMLAQHEFAQPPYPNCWVEFDQSAYWEGLGGIPDEKADTRIAFWYDKNEHDKITTVYVLAQNKERSADILPFIYMLHCPWTMSEQMKTCQLFGISRMQLQCAVLGVEPRSTQTGKHYFDIIKDVCATHAMTYKTDVIESMSLEQRASLLTACAGDLKRIIILSLLLTRSKNILFIDNEQPRSHGLHKGKRAVYMAHHTLTMKLSHDKAKRLIKRSMGPSHRGSPRRHEVRGHWCTQRKGQWPDCAHVWDRLNERTYQCVKCGRKRWFREAFTRGDAGVGYVTKDYEVTK